MSKLKIPRKENTQNAGVNLVEWVRMKRNGAVLVSPTIRILKVAPNLILIGFEVSSMYHFSVELSSPNDVSF